MTTSTIVVGVDGARHSARALEWCAQYAPRLDARVIVVHAVEVPVRIGAGPGDRPAVVRAMPEPERSAAERAVRRNSEPLLHGVASFDVVCMQGDVPAVLDHVAQRVDADLVVVGHHDPADRACSSAPGSGRFVHRHQRPLVVVP